MLIAGWCSLEEVWLSCLALILMPSPLDVTSMSAALSRQLKCGDGFAVNTTQAVVSTVESVTFFRLPCRDVQALVSVDGRLSTVEVGLSR